MYRLIEINHVMRSAFELKFFFRKQYYMESFAFGVINRKKNEQKPEYYPIHFRHPRAKMIVEKGKPGTLQLDDHTFPSKLCHINRFTSTEWRKRRLRTKDMMIRLAPFIIYSAPFFYERWSFCYSPTLHKVPELLSFPCAFVREFSS